MNAICWCCRKTIGHCLCQEEAAEICVGCNRCLQHCRCKQQKPPVNENRNRARRRSSPQRLRVRIYIAGSRSKEAVARIQRGAIKMQEQLVRAGFAPYCPCLAHPLDAGNILELPSLIELDLPWLKVSEAVLCLSAKSADAEQEITFALQKAILVFQNVDDLLEYFEMK